jgi:hypothetical protein
MGEARERNEVLDHGSIELLGLDAPLHYSIIPVLQSFRSVKP